MPQRPTIFGPEPLPPRQRSQKRERCRPNAAASNGSAESSNSSRRFARRRRPGGLPAREARSQFLTHLGELLEPPPVRPAHGPPTDWGELVRLYHDRDVFQASSDDVPAIGIHGPQTHRTQGITGAAIGPDSEECPFEPDDPTGGRSDPLVWGPGRNAPPAGGVAVPFQLRPCATGRREPAAPRPRQAAGRAPSWRSRPPRGCAGGRSPRRRPSRLPGGT